MDVELLNKLISYILEKKTAVNTIGNQLQKSCSWYTFSYRQINDATRNYNFKYLGELCELSSVRFSTQEQHRALALAIGLTANVVTSDMFVNNQRPQYLSGLRKRAGQDYYFLAAYNLIAVAWGYELMGEDRLLAPQTLGELYLATLMLDPSDGFHAFQEQLVLYCSHSSAEDLWGNYALLGDMLYRYEAYIKGKLPKTTTILKDMLSLCKRNAYPGTPFVQRLLQSGYTMEEILLLNVGFLFVNASRSRHSETVSAQKLAALYCEIILSSEAELAEPFQLTLCGLIKEYSSFKHKIENMNGIIPYLTQVGNVRITTPEKLLWLYSATNPKTSLFLYDVFNPAFDMLAQKLIPSEYVKLFDIQMELLQNDKEQQLAYIKRFEEITQNSYAATFNDPSMGKDRPAFSWLVDTGVIKLQSFFSKYVPVVGAGNIEQKDLQNSHLAVRYVFQYCKKIRNRESYAFLAWLYQTYRQEDIHSLYKEYGVNPFEGILCTYSVRTNCVTDEMLKLQRLFLNNEETVELYTWLESYYYHVERNDYFLFLLCSLCSEQLLELLGPEHLHPLYLAAVEHCPEKWAQVMTDIHQTEEEQASQQALDEERKRLAEQARMEKENAHKISRFHMFYTGTFTSLEKSINYSGSLPHCRQALYELLNITGSTLHKDDYISFLACTAELLSQNGITLQEALVMQKSIQEVPHART